jgi:hypothetical protein
MSVLLICLHSLQSYTMPGDAWPILRPVERPIDFFTIVNGANRSIKWGTYYDIVSRVIVVAMTIVLIILMCIHNSMFTKDHDFFEFPFFVITGTIHLILMSALTYVQYSKAYNTGEMMNTNSNYATWHNKIMEHGALGRLSIIGCVVNLGFFIWAWVMLSNKSCINWHLFMDDYFVISKIFYGCVIYWTVQIVISFACDCKCECR